MASRFTRIVGALQERTLLEIPDGVPFVSGLFEVHPGPDGWRLEPRQPLRLNGHLVEAPQPLDDDDFIDAGNSLWVFHTGATARDETIEAAALDGPPHGTAWEVLSDWLQERGDALGERIARERLLSHLQRELHPHPHAEVYSGGRARLGDAAFRLEVDEDNGVARRLIARSLNPDDRPHVEAALHLRQLRYLQHLVLDLREPQRDLDRTLAELERWQLPHWLETISFGVLHGSRPENWTSRELPASLRDRCPHLRLQPLVRWASRAAVEVADDQGHYTLLGLQPGKPSRVISGTAIDVHAPVLRLHQDSTGNAGQYAFDRVGYFWYLRERQLDPPQKISIGGVRVRRTPLLPLTVPRTSLDARAFTTELPLAVTSTTSAARTVAMTFDAPVSADGTDGAPSGHTSRTTRPPRAPLASPFTLECASP